MIYVYTRITIGPLLNILSLIRTHTHILSVSSMGFSQTVYHAQIWILLSHNNVSAIFGCRDIEAVRVLSLMIIKQSSTHTLSLTYELQLDCLSSTSFSSSINGSKQSAIFGR